MESFLQIWAALVEKRTNPGLAQLRPYLCKKISSRYRASERGRSKEGVWHTLSVIRPRFGREEMLFCFRKAGRWHFGCITSAILGPPVSKSAKCGTRNGISTTKIFNRLELLALNGGVDINRFCINSFGLTFENKPLINVKKKRESL